MNPTTFDPTADATGNYAFAIAVLRLRMLIDGDRHPQPDEVVDLVLWADCERTRGATMRAVPA